MEFFVYPRKQCNRTVSESITNGLRLGAYREATVSPCLQDGSSSKLDMMPVLDRVVFTYSELSCSRSPHWRTSHFFPDPFVRLQYKGSPHAEVPAKGSLTTLEGTLEPC